MMLRNKAQCFELVFSVVQYFLLLLLIVVYGYLNILHHVHADIMDVSVTSNITVCDNVTISCRVRSGENIVWWTQDGENVTQTKRIAFDQISEGDQTLHMLHISCVNFSDIGNYSCHVLSGVEMDETVSHIMLDNISVPIEIWGVEDKVVKAGESAVFTCIVTGYPLHRIKWKRLLMPVSNKINITKGENGSWAKSELFFDKVSRKDNGSYVCSASGPHGSKKALATLFVLDKPQVNIDLVKAVGASSVFLNWTVNDGNRPVENFILQYIKNGSNSWNYNSDLIDGHHRNYTIKNLEPNTKYMFGLTAKNSMGPSTVHLTQKWVKTLDKDPVFIPEVSVKGVTPNSITIGWSQPQEPVKYHVHYYQLAIENSEIQKQAVHTNQNLNLYMFIDLEPATTYNFKVAACSDYTKCGNWSKEVNGTTMDGESGPPENVTVLCRFDNISHSSFVFVSWLPPLEPNGKIVHYNVVLDGVATFKSDDGRWMTITYDANVKFVDEKSNSARFDKIPPNTNYTVRVTGVTRSKSKGVEVAKHCTMPPTIPDREKMPHFHWEKVEDEGNYIFKLTLKRLSERNGPICCYRIFLVKLNPYQTIADLPPPEDFPVSTYDEVKRKGGAYLAELFESDALRRDVFLGDGRLMNANHSLSPCCVSQLSRHMKTTEAPTSAPTFQTTQQNDIVSSIEVTAPSSTVPVESDIPIAEASRIRRADLETTENVQDLPSPFPSTTVQSNTQSNIYPIYDGELDIGSNYSGFVEVIVYGSEHLLPAYSGYFVALRPGPGFENLSGNNDIVQNALIGVCAFLGVVFFILLVLCLLQRYNKHIAEEQGVEMTLTNSVRHLCQTLRSRHTLVSSNPPDMTPIAKADLPAAFYQKHCDSDYGFQHEYEMLPDKFPDRTARNSEARENFLKNRYPDIKAYDQTRVRLSQIDSVLGSDYINANFVMGYKERKKFICAQGPMDNTICDFWRMVWEQNLELILMLTNLDEYSKTKCSKYWPDEGKGSKVYGDITLNHVQEKRYSDFIIRELKMCRSGGSSKEGEERIVVQYHYLVWKDYHAPEHPSGILKFIKRVNEAYSPDKGPILVHCSAGVGRTGTLVALDTLLQQMAEEGQVAIFNTVCDLRHQRNFLVQSLKQYIFIYRTLMEMAQFGDTEIKISEIKSVVDRLKQRENGKEKCRLEEEFDKMSLVLEERKSIFAAENEENRSKNRSESIIPYDRNRVILTPIPGREYSTYINASFIEGYDNSESFIITQDPLESTISDFWRMVSEHSISTIIMLSDFGDGPKKCLRYWPDEEMDYDHINVKYIQNESCPYYTRREFSVTNTKTDDNLIVTQFQYNGWPTVEGEVPEVTRGVIELMSQAQFHQEYNGGTAPIAVHCNLGSDRSSIFVALCILVQQLRVEKTVDFFSTTRKLRSQRPGMLQSFAEYEFLHRAIVNYIDLHNLANGEA